MSRTSATAEDYPPNVRLAAQRLTPFGVQVADTPVTDADPMAFADGEFDLVYLRAVPWLVPGFSVAAHSKKLFALQRRLERGERLSVLARKCLIEAQRGLRL
jgi:hypothetical protein